MAELEHALHSKVIHLHTKIKIPAGTGTDEAGKAGQALIETTAGRVMLGHVLPKSPKISYDVIKQADDQARNLRRDRPGRRHCGQKETVIFCDRIMALGFLQCVQAGISFGKGRHGGAATPSGRSSIPPVAGEGFRAAYNDRPDHHGEKYNKVVDAWSKATEEIAKER